ncbi:hypothetical protein C8R47DRAFT_78489 [Mycena vitilis]|nr:hypothetical protein C8R47DRAFT_78489 [Mycena vitilis]
MFPLMACLLLGKLSLSSLLSIAGLRPRFLTLRRHPDGAQAVNSTPPSSALTRSFSNQITPAVSSLWAIRFLIIVHANDSAFYNLSKLDFSNGI